MSARLIRALQRGGCAVERSTGAWSIWRSQDRRGRAIGQIPAIDMEILYVRGDVAPLGTSNDGRMIWAGAVASLQNKPISSTALTTKSEQHTHRRQPLLHRILRTCIGADRKRLAQAARDFLEDIQRAQTNGLATGMNWQAVAAGTRIQGGRARPQVARSHHGAAAAARIQALNEQLCPQDIRLLERLIVDEDTRFAIARWQGFRARDAEIVALAALRRLAEAYDMAVKRPARARRLCP